MEELQARIAYLHGLANGLERVDGQQMGELMRGILEALDGIAGELEALREDASELDEYVQSVDEDLAQVENEFWSSPEEGSRQEQGATTSTECPNCNLVLEFQPSDFADEEGRVELICPNCGETIRLEKGRREGARRDSREGAGASAAGRARMRASARRERGAVVTLAEDERG
ncbi:MAG: hypothetical protein QJR08_09960 [Bacillota bacterium]|nr:hypothetical protein [Bacillota bacterium]